MRDLSRFALYTLILWITLFIALFLATCLTSCAGHPDPDISKLSVKVKAPRTWMLEKGPMPVTVFFKNPPAEPVIVDWYICYAIVNGGQCQYENLRYRQVRLLSRLDMVNVVFRRYDWIMASGQRDRASEQDFFNRHNEGNDAFSTMGSAEEASFGTVILEIRVLDRERTQGLMTKRHELRLDCATCA